jgi:hypothetical protein
MNDKDNIMVYISYWDPLTQEIASFDKQYKLNAFKIHHKEYGADAFEEIINHINTHEDMRK